MSEEPKLTANQQKLWNQKVLELGKDRDFDFEQSVAAKTILLAVSDETQGAGLTKAAIDAGIAAANNMPRISDPLASPEIENGSYLDPIKAVMSEAFDQALKEPSVNVSRRNSGFNKGK